MTERYKCLYHLMTFFYTTSMRRRVFTVLKLMPKYKKVGKAMQRLDDVICESSSCKNHAEYMVSW